MDEIIKKLKDHDKRFDHVDKRLDQVDKRLDRVDKRFDQQERQIDLLAHSVLSHTERLDRIEENMVTKTDHQEVMNTLDEILKITKKKDEELTALTHNLRRTDDKVEKHDKDINN